MRIYICPCFEFAKFQFGKILKKGEYNPFNSIYFAMYHCFMTISEVIFLYNCTETYITALIDPSCLAKTEVIFSPYTPVNTLAELVI